MVDRIDRLEQDVVGLRNDITFIRGLLEIGLREQGIPFEEYVPYHRAPAVQPAPAPLSEPASAVPPGGDDDESSDDDDATGSDDGDDGSGSGADVEMLL